MNEPIRFGEFEFSPDSGELRRFANGASGVERLGPMPSRLLTLLLQHDGDLLTRDEIRKELWPDVSVDFDSNLHYCVRQVRAALEDSAADPKYIETLPRRGYRLITPIAAVHDDTPRPAARGIASRRMWILTTLILSTAVVGTWVLTDREVPHAERPLRIGVMPFRPIGSRTEQQARGVAERILEDLMSSGGDRVELIGPTSTERYRDEGATLRQIAEVFQLDFIVNARFIEDDTGPNMLAELIRLPDGAHVWVERYRNLDDAQAIGREISSKVLSEIGLGN